MAQNNTIDPSSVQPLDPPQSGSQGQGGIDPSSVQPLDNQTAQGQTTTAPASGLQSPTFSSRFVENGPVGAFEGVSKLMDAEDEYTKSHPFSAMEYYHQALDALRKGDYKGATAAAGKVLAGNDFNEDNPLRKAAEQILTSPFTELTKATKYADAATRHALNEPGTPDASVQEVDKGDVVGNLESAAKHAVQAIPVAGKPISDTVDDARSGHYGAALGDLVGGLSSFGLAKILGPGSAAEGEEAGAAGKEAGVSQPTVRPKEIDVAGKKIPVASNTPNLPGKQSLVSRAFSSVASKQGAKDFVQNHVAPAAREATHATFAQSAIDDVNTMRTLRGDDPVQTPTLNNADDVGDYLQKQGAKPTYQKLDSAIAPEQQKYDAAFAQKTQEAETLDKSINYANVAVRKARVGQMESKQFGDEMAIKRANGNLADARLKLSRLQLKQAQTPTPEEALGERPMGITEFKDKIHELENVADPDNQFSTGEAKAAAVKQLPVLRNNLQDFLDAHKDVVNPDELSAADRMYAKGYQYKWIGQQLRGASRGIGAGNTFEADPLTYETKQLESLPSRFNKKYKDDNAWANLLGQRGVRNYNDILHTLQDPRTGSAFLKLMQKFNPVEIPVGSAAEAGAGQVSNAVLFNPDAGQTLLKVWRASLAHPRLSKGIDKLVLGAGATGAAINGAQSTPTPTPKPWEEYAAQQ